LRGELELAGGWGIAYFSFKARIVLLEYFPVPKVLWANTSCWAPSYWAPKLSISLHLYNQKLSATTKVIVHKYNDARSEVAAKRVNLTDHVRARFYNVDFLSRGMIFNFM